tara:strand:+ start:310 stop:504 length:195 start_codon:yes stop_codon:yes gene_type:complete
LIYSIKKTPNAAAASAVPSMDVLVLSGAVIVPLYEPDDIIVARLGSPAVGRHRPTAKRLCRRRA